uniref:Probable ATP-dependent transporter ycf16 n=1 Tax=Bostrychia tenella TaxID=324755 RepID=A0A1Z1M5V2_9FLOR|nr:Iron-sulfur cluster formation ABC transporterATP-binding subunit [Bostrychia tenella]ARW61233.1 Iron-sulfur cluster formation ABC transporterATP-binding subunit [Bostrychia tenella]
MTNNNILTIKDLHVSIQHKPIINGLNLSVSKGQVHAIMGKNGSGKSTLAKVIAGHPHYKITRGKIILNQEDVTYQDPDIRSHKGIFLAFQYPVEIPGVSNLDFLRSAYNSRQRAYNQKELDPLSFFELINKKLKSIDMDSIFLNRNVNEGFSGGEKKKNEILQMLLLNNKLSILDEIDSGLDVDALKNISKNINYLANQNNAILLITHYQRFLDYIKPDYVHIMSNGHIIYTGDADTAVQIEKYGYDYIQKI